MGNILKQGQKQNLTKLNLDYDGKKDGEDQVENYLNIVNDKIGFIPNVLGAFVWTRCRYDSLQDNGNLISQMQKSDVDRDSTCIVASKSCKRCSTCKT